MLRDVLADAFEQRRVLGEALDEQRPRAFERGLGVGDVEVRGLAARRDVLRGFRLRRERRIGQQRVRERCQARLARDLRLRASLRLVGEIDVLELLLGRRIFDGRAQRRRQLALLLDAREHRHAARLELAQVFEALGERAQRDVVELAGRFLAIARDEGHGRAFVEQRDGGGDLPGLHAELGGDAFVDGRQHEADEQKAANANRPRGRGQGGRFLARL